MASTSSNRRVFLSGLAAVPAMSLPVVAAPATSDLARACIQAVSHRIWIDEAPAARGWDDDRLSSETAKVNAVVDRAIAEPSAGLRDIAAKARLGLDGMELNEDENDGPGMVLVATVLREIIAMGALA